MLEGITKNNVKNRRVINSMKTFEGVVKEIIESVDHSTGEQNIHDIAIAVSEDENVLNSIKDYVLNKHQFKYLAQKLADTTQLCGQYFEVGSLLLINIALSEDGAQEYEVYKRSDEEELYYKFEQITASWMSKESIFDFLQTYDKKHIIDIKREIPSYMSDLLAKKPSFERVRWYKEQFNKMAESM